MSVLDRLASALRRNDEAPNVELAERIAASGDASAVTELAAALAGKGRAIANDAIKALYEIGERRPELIAPHAGAFFDALESRNNRLVWGALSALAAITATQPNVIAARLPEILDAADRSSVIAKDKTVAMLATLAERPDVAPAAWDLLLGTLRTSAVNQTPMYAEQALRAAAANDPAALSEVVRHRLADIDRPAKRVRLEKVLRKLAALDAG
jgi:hypothetical protein